MFDAPFEKFEHENHKVELYTDWDAGNPFEDFDQAAELVGFEPFARDFKCALALDEDRFESTAHAARYLTLARGYLVALPFQFDDYGSGGYRVTLVDADADRAAGFVCVSPEGMALTGAPDAERAAHEDFETFRMWAEGEVVGYVVKDADGLEVDSLWGIYDVDEARQEAREAAEWENRDRLVNQEPTDVAEVLAGAV